MGIGEIPVLSVVVVGAFAWIVARRRVVGR